MKKSKEFKDDNETIKCKLWNFAEWFFNPTAGMIASILAAIFAVIGMILGFMGY